MTTEPAPRPWPTMAERRAEAMAKRAAALDALRARLRAYAREHGGRFILFGSTVKGRDRPDSDVDIITDFAEDDRLAGSLEAEEACWALDLKPDVRPLIWTSPKVLARAEAEGEVIS